MKFPTSMKAGLAMGLLGGLVAFFAMAYLFNGSGKPLEAMGLCLLIAVMFFALAGGFSKTSQWNQNVLIGYSFITAGVVIGIMIINYLPLWFTTIELVIGILAVAFAALGGTKTYLSKPREA